MRGPEGRITAKRLISRSVSILPLRDARLAFVNPIGEAGHHRGGGDALGERRSTGHRERRRIVERLRLLLEPRTTKFVAQ